MKKINRANVEKQLVRKLAERVKDSGFELTFEDYAGRFNHNVVFICKKGMNTYELSLRFAKPNYLQMYVDFAVYNETITNLYRELSLPFPEYAEKYGFNVICILDMDMNYFGRENYSTFCVDDGSGLENVDITHTANKICERYFFYIEKELIPNMDTLEKLNNIINSEKNFDQNEVVFNLLCYPIQSQIWAGVALCFLLKPKNYKELLVKYKTYCDKEFPMPRKDEEIDLVYTLFKKQAPEMG